MASQQGSFSVISTYVEMILTPTSSNDDLVGDLHVCGDDPATATTKLTAQKWSPRMWRWSWIAFLQLQSLWVISTYVEMILDTFSTYLLHFCDLHVCGDDPASKKCFQLC